MKKKTNKSPFTEEEIEEFKAMLYDVAALSMNGAMYRGRKDYAMAYNSYQVKQMEIKQEQIDREAEEDAIKLLESKGYKVTR